MYAYIDTNILTIPIELVDTPYRQHFVDKLHLVSDWTVQTSSRPTVKNYNSSVVKSNWDILKLTYYKLCKILGHTPKYSLPDNFDNSNYYLNILHRYFTTAHTFNTWDGKSFEMDETIFSLIHSLNDSVHVIENYVTNDKMLPYLENPIKWMEIMGNPDTIEKIFPLDKYPEYISKDYNVYAIKHITGKDFITSYFDNDTANAWDIQNFHITYIGLCIDVFGDFKRIWSSKHFKKWIKQNNFTGKIGYFPVGNISQENIQYLQENFYNTTVNSVTV